VTHLLIQTRLLSVSALFLQSLPRTDSDSKNRYAYLIPENTSCSATAHPTEILLCLAEGTLAIGASAATTMRYVILSGSFALYQLRMLFNIE
jgi:hypothetical protein